MIVFVVQQYLEYSKGEITMKKVVIISGSKRKGNTLGIANIYVSEFKNKGYTAKLIDLSSQELDYCDGCLSCDETQVCKINDNFVEIINELRSADILILGTPARWRLLSGELKSFIDRLNPYAAVEGYADINVFVYAVGQSSEEEGASILNAIDSVCAFAEDAGMNILGTQAFYELYGAEDYKDNKVKIVETCKDNVEMLYKVIK